MKFLIHKRFIIFLSIAFLIICIAVANFKIMFDNYSMKDAVCAENFYADIDNNGQPDMVIKACYYPNNSGIIIDHDIPSSNPPK